MGSGSQAAQQRQYRRAESLKSPPTSTRLSLHPIAVFIQHTSESHSTRRPLHLVTTE